MKLPNPLNFNSFFLKIFVACLIWKDEQCHVIETKTEDYCSESVVWVSGRSRTRITHRFLIPIQVVVSVALI